MDSKDPFNDFDADPSLAEVIAKQGKGPLQDPRVLLGDFWPENERVEDFLAALRDWRGHGRNDRAA